jgi:predicted CXXCH cytochrome family protein
LKKLTLGGKDVKFKMTLILVAIALVSFGLYGTGYAFHDGGVAGCEGCHTMHNSLSGSAMNTQTSQFQTGQYLLKGTDASSACLNCHGTGDATNGYHVSTHAGATGGEGTAPLQPGRAFAAMWLKQTATATTATMYGHNIVAADFSYNQDGRLAAAPGGTFGADQFYCSSCHNPHGQTRRLSDGTFATPAIGTAVAPIEESGSYGAVPADATVAVGAYRLLGGAGYTPKSQSSAVSFTNDPPHAVSPSSYNSTTIKGGVRVAYGMGMSEWCANCHGGVKTTGYMSGQTGAGTRHPAGNDALLSGSGIAAIYNAYKKSGDLMGDQASSFDPLVPYEEGSADYAALVAVQATTAGPISGTENVQCLSCHRAHASGFKSMLRWDMAEALITNGTGGWEMNYGPDTILTAAYYLKTPADFGPAQRVLCNKCHAKD